jgi:hypothetical protein
LLIENEIKDQKKLYDVLEPTKHGYNKRKEAVFTASIPTWLDIVREIGTFWKTNKAHIWLPNIKQ